MRIHRTSPVEDVTPWPDTSHEPKKKKKERRRENQNPVDAGAFVLRTCASLRSMISFITALVRSSEARDG